MKKQGHGVRTIARALKVSRNTVRKVLQSGSTERSTVSRPELLEAHVDRIRHHYARCRGNLVRVWEELSAEGIRVGYSTLTGFCRRYDITPVRPRKQRAGRYDFDPGVEMQHDTSPHAVEIGGRQRVVQCASLVLCYSRMLYFQVYETYNRFLARVFLAKALRYFGGAAQRCIIDNSSVIVIRGTGANAVMAAKMRSFTGRYGFTFQAHELGDKNRSGKVERPFSYIEGNFYAGRTFTDLKDLNRQAVEWCNRTSNPKFKGTIQAKPIELFQAERLALQPHPIFVPEVYELHHRIVDLEGYVNLHTNRYSAPDETIGRKVQVRETGDRIIIMSGSKTLCEHERLEARSRKRSTLPEHQHTGRWKRGGAKGYPPLPEETTLRQAAPELSQLIDAIKKKHGGRSARHVRKLHRMFLDYPTETLRAVVAEALAYGLLDLKRIERMVLRNIAGNFFKLPLDGVPE